MMLPLLFGISGGEILVILVFILLLFGSKGIPDIARTMGRTMRQLRDASNEVQREIHRGANDVRRTMEEQRKAFHSAGPDDTTPPPPSKNEGTTGPPPSVH